VLVAKSVKLPRSYSLMVGDNSEISVL